jgi:predicted DsbA family dithiol-disulfide isomerase
MQIDVWSDIACPWCAIGRRRLQLALEQFPHADQVQLTWHSFELDPEAPPERTGDRVERIARKYGAPPEQIAQRQDQMAQEAAAEGLELHFDRVRDGNSFDAHRLIHLAAAHGLQDAMKGRLLEAHFRDGELISDHDTLARLAAEVGVPEDEARAVLASDRFAEEVRTDEYTAHRLGITAVPYFVIDRRFGVPGAQPPELLLKGLEHAWSEHEPIAVPDGAACRPGEPDC